MFMARHDPPLSTSTRMGAVRDDRRRIRWHTVRSRLNAQPSVEPGLVKHRAQPVVPGAAGTSSQPMSKASGTAVCGHSEMRRRPLLRTEPAEVRQFDFLA
jgi:hypothetical protein